MRDTGLRRVRIRRDADIGDRHELRDIGVRIICDRTIGPVRPDRSDVGGIQAQTLASRLQEGTQLLGRRQCLAGQIDQRFQALGVAQQRRFELALTLGRGLKLGDVLDHREHHGPLADSAGQQGNPQVSPKKRTIGLAIAFGRSIEVALSRDKLPVQDKLRRQIIRTGQLIEAHPDQILLRIAEKVAEHAVGQRQSPVGTRDRDPDG